jgi:HSP20 family protein
VKEDEKAFHVTADLPGLTEKDVEVTYDEGLLTLKGEKKVVREETKDTWHITERSSGSFTRQIALPSTIDAAAIEARFEKGVLLITLPKLAAAQAQAKKIAIKAG